MPISSASRRRSPTSMLAPPCRGHGICGACSSCLIRVEQGSLYTGSDVLSDGRRTVAGELPDGAAADELEFGRGDQEDGVDLRCDVAIDAVHLEFVVEVLRRPQAADVESDIVLPAVVDQQAGELPDMKSAFVPAEPFHLRQRSFDQVQALGDRKEAAALLGIDADHDVQLVDDEAGATDDIEMPARRGIE